jgi:hypothetical protein
LIHIGDPDHALTTVPVLCLIGGAVLGRFLENRGSQRLLSTATVVVTLNVFLFFVPPVKLARACSYQAVAGIDRVTRAAIDDVAELHLDRPLILLHYGSAVSWRQLSYYFPKDYLIVLPGLADAPWLIREHQRLPIQHRNGAIILPGHHRIVFLSGSGIRSRDAPWKQHGAAFYLDSDIPRIFGIGPYRLTALSMR